MNHVLLTLVATLASACAGVVGWTLAEYLLHRFLGHHGSARGSAFGREHTRHHSEGDYFAPGWKKAAVAVVVVAVAGSASAFVVGVFAVVFWCAFVVSYAAYEVVHRRHHTHRGQGAWGAFLRRHHFHHHFVNPRSNHGVTSPLWDIVFGTREVPGVPTPRGRRIRVPRRLRMAWLTDPRDPSRVADDLAGDYELVG